MMVNKDIQVIKVNQEIEEVLVLLVKMELMFVPIIHISEYYVHFI